MNRAKQVGTAWESKIVTFLQEKGWPHAERRALAGINDKGDLTGIPGLCVEAKSHNRITLAEWMNELAVEVKNSGALVGVVWAHRKGKSSAAEGYVIMTGEQFASLLKEAGY